MTQDDAPRIQASEVALFPEIGGHTNVQDALAAGAGAVLGNFTTDLVPADASTPLTGDGAQHSVRCVVAAPPAWMDNAGNITEPGLYNIVTQVLASAGPTTPGQYITVSGAFNAFVWLPCDALGAGGAAEVIDIQSLAAGDVPYGTTVAVAMPTDVTEAVGVTLTVIRLAH